MDWNHQNRFAGQRGATFSVGVVQEHNMPWSPAPQKACTAWWHRDYLFLAGGSCILIQGYRRCFVMFCDVFWKLLEVDSDFCLKNAKKMPSVCFQTVGILVQLSRFVGSFWVFLLNTRGGVLATPFWRGGKLQTFSFFPKKVMSERSSPKIAMLTNIPLQLHLTNLAADSLLSPASSVNVPAMKPKLALSHRCSNADIVPLQHKNIGSKGFEIICCWSFFTPGNSLIFWSLQQTWKRRGKTVNEEVSHGVCGFPKELW